MQFNGDNAKNIKMFCSFESDGQIHQGIIIDAHDDPDSDIILGVQQSPDPRGGEDNFRPNYCIVTKLGGNIARHEPTPLNLLRTLAELLGYNLTPWSAEERSKWLDLPIPTPATTGIAAIDNRTTDSLTGVTGTFVRPPHGGYSSAEEAVAADARLRFMEPPTTLTAAANDSTEPPPT